MFASFSHVSRSVSFRLNLVAAAVLVPTVLVVASFASQAHATLMNPVSTNTTSQTFFPASGTDLIDQSQLGVSLVGATHGTYTSFGGSSADRLTDFGDLGIASDVTTVAFSATSPSGSPVIPWTSTYTLDTSIYDQGYTITNINTYAGWSGSRSGQGYTIRYTTVDNATPQVLGSFSATDIGTGSTRIEIFDTSGTILTGVNSILFDVTNANNTYREFDVIGFGVSTPAPEPSAALLLGLGWLGLMFRTRRRRAT